MDIDIIEAGQEHRSIIKNLARFYIYDFSAYVHADLEWYRCQEDGTFNSGMDHYFENPDATVFIIRAGGEWAGFAMVLELNDEPEADFNIAEFFITRPLRDKGIGRHVAFTLFDRFNGRWDVLVLPANTAAIVFWEKVISEYTSGTSRTSFEREHRHGHGKRLCIHRFTSREFGDNRR